MNADNLKPYLLEHQNQMEKLIQNIKTPFWYPTSDMKDSSFIKELEVKKALVERWNHSLAGRLLVTPPKGEKNPRNYCRNSFNLNENGTIMVHYVYSDYGGWNLFSFAVPEKVFLNPDTTTWKDVKYNEENKVPELPVSTDNGTECWEGEPEEN